MEFRQTWQRKVTPAGRLYWAHTASARPTAASGCTGWRTCCAADADRVCLTPVRLAQKPKAGQHSLTQEMALVPTPPAATTSTAHWATVRVTGNGGNGNPCRAEDSRGRLEDQVYLLHPWATVKVSPGKWQAGPDGQPTWLNLAGQADLVADLPQPWVSPTSRDWKDTPIPVSTTNPDGSTRSRLDQLPRQAAHFTPLPLPSLAAHQTPHCPRENDSEHSGSTYLERATLGHFPLPSPAAMANTAASASNTSPPPPSPLPPMPWKLNTHFARWLMGFPPAWAAALHRAAEARQRERQPARTRTRAPQSSGRLPKASATAKSNSTAGATPSSPKSPPSSSTTP